MRHRPLCDTVHYATPECLPEETWLQKRSPSTEVFGTEAPDARDATPPAACEPVMAIGEIQLLTGAASVWYRCRALCLGFDLQTTYSLKSGAQHVGQSVSRSRYSRQRTSVMHVPPPPSHESTSTAELSNGRPDLHTAILSHAEEERKKIFESSREPS